MRLPALLRLAFNKKPRQWPGLSSSILLPNLLYNWNKIVHERYRGDAFGPFIQPGYGSVDTANFQIETWGLVKHGSAIRRSYKDNIVPLGNAKVTGGLSIIEVVQSRHGITYERVLGTPSVRRNKEHIDCGRFNRSMYNPQFCFCGNSTIVVSKNQSIKPLRKYTCGNNGV